MRVLKTGKVLSFVLVLVLICSLLCVPAFASNYTDSVTTLYNTGNSVYSGTYKIYDQTDMNNFVLYVNAGRNTSGVTFEIDSSVTTALNVTSVIAAPTTIKSASTYSPYVYSGTGFQGTFNGNNKTINVTISTSASGTGLFGYLAPAGTVKNLVVTGTVGVSGSKDAVGGVVGYNSGTINHVTSSVAVTATSSYNVGGMTGFNNGYYNTSGNAASSGLKGIIVNCTNSGAIEGYSKVGGICGENSGAIRFCGNTGSVTGDDGSKNGTGGIAGRNGNNNTALEKGKIFDCYNRGAISVPGGKWCGGITGFNNSLSIVKNCYNTGTYTASSYCNAIIGNNENSSVVQADNYASTSTGTGTASEKGTYTTNMNSDTFRAKLETGAIQANIWAYSSSVNGGYPYGNGNAAVPDPSSYGTNNSYSVIYLDGTNGNDSNAGNTSSTAVKTLGKAVTLADSSTVSTVYISLVNPVTITNTQTVYSDGVTVKWGKNDATGPMFTISGSGNLTVGGVSFDGQYSSTVKVGTGFSVGSGASLTLRNNASIANCGTAVNVASGGTLTVNKASISGTTNSIYNSGTLTIDGNSSTSISSRVYVNTGSTFNYGGAGITTGTVVYLNNTNLVNCYITLTSAITSSNALTVQCGYEAKNVQVARGDNSVLSSSVSNISYGGSSNYTINPTIYHNNNSNYYAIRLKTAS